MRQLGQQGDSGLTGVSRHGGLRWAVGYHRPIKGSGNIKGNINFGNIHPLWVNLLPCPWTYNATKNHIPNSHGEGPFRPTALWPFYVKPTLDDTAFVLNVL